MRKRGGTRLDSRKGNPDAYKPYYMVRLGAKLVSQYGVREEDVGGLLEGWSAEAVHVDAPWRGGKVWYVLTLLLMIVDDFDDAEGACSMFEHGGGACGGCVKGGRRLCVILLSS